MRWRLLAFGLGVYAAALLVSVPATWIDWGLRRASDGRVRLAQARGTLWTGTGTLEVLELNGRAGLAKPMAWRWRPAALPRARLAYEIELDRSPDPVALEISLSGVDIANIDSLLPASALGLGMPALAVLELTGELRLRVSNLSISQGATRGSASLQWRGAGAALSPVSPLGNYELRIDGDGPTVRVRLQTLNGPLQLDGDGAWANGSKPVFHGSARAPTPFASRLAPFLRLIAVERADGSFGFELK